MACGLGRRRPSPFALGLGATAVESRCQLWQKAAAQPGEARNGKLDTQAQIEARAAATDR